MKVFTLLVLTLSISAYCAADSTPAAVGPSEQTSSSWTHGAMVSAANPHAVNAAMEMLRQGGHAVDATIAAHAVLGLVEPQSSGLGGGGFMLVYEQDGNALTFHDGREAAPASATADMFINNGALLGYIEAWQGGLGVAVPGTIALYKAAHEQHGNLPWEKLFVPAIKLAQEGFEVSPRLANYLPKMARVSRLDEAPAAAAYFYPGGEALQTGHLLKNPEYAHTLRRVAAEGPAAFYRGEIAEAMVEAALQAPNPGRLALADMVSYRSVKREAICGQFRENKICTTSPPSSGAAQIMMAGIYDHLTVDAKTQEDKTAAFVDAQRLAYADRDHFFGDPDANDIPLQELIDPAYLKHRASQRFAPGATPSPGDPYGFMHPGAQASTWADDTTEEKPGTTHLSIIDAQGNAVSMTASVGGPFGSSRLVGGFLLNNHMTDFARQVSPDGKPMVNAIGPGRRPRSSMSPIIVFDARGDLRMVTGSPGGNSILAYNTKSLLGVLDWGMTAQQASDFPNLVARGKQVKVEISMEPGPAIAKDLRARGYDVKESSGENSGLHTIVVHPDSLEGSADSRREGIVRSIPPTDNLKE